MALSLSIPSAQAAGVITSAPGVDAILAKVLAFVLSIIGVLGIIGLVIAGALYFFAAGDIGRVRLAKQAALASVIGIVVALSALLLTGQLANFFS